MSENAKIKSCLIKIFICIFVFTFYIGCSFDTAPSFSGNKVSLPPEDYSDTKEIKNAYLQLDFDNYNTHRITQDNSYFRNDEMLAKWRNKTFRASGVLRNNHGQVCVLDGSKGIKSSFGVTVTIPENACLTFDFKSDMYYSDVLTLRIDNSKYRVVHKGNGETWRNVSVPLSRGIHEIEWILPAMKGYSSGLLNVMYIDNISIVKDEVAYVDIYPKGLQETYTDGIPIKFNAVPKRSDGSVIENKSISYSVSGCGNIDSSGVFRPTGKGNCTVTASVDGKTAQKTDIVVHGRDYLSEPVKIGNYTFTGNVRLNSSDSTYVEDLDTTNTKYDYTQTPKGTNFNADGFFVLKGNTTERLWINVKKDGTKYETNYFIRNVGDFYKRIWLRFGPGKYIITIFEAPNMEFFDTQDSKYEGDLKSADGCLFVKKLTVINTNQISTEDAVFIMPSEVVQSESFYVSNIANAILASLSENATTGDKLRAVHDWELYNYYYDMASVNHNGERRKRQDAEHVIKYGTGVCEGYANLYAALLRNIGIPAKVICSYELLHAWNHVFYNGNWYLVDVTWDDPVTSDSDLYNDKAPGRENYTYFMTAHTDSSTHEGKTFGHTDEGFADISRSAIADEQLPSMTGLPDGWY